MRYPISILALSSISALGGTREDVWQSYLTKSALFSEMQIAENIIKVSRLSSEMQHALSQLQDEHSAFKNLDKTALLAIMASQNFNGAANFRIKNRDKIRTGINIGSSRGATELFEKYYNQFQKEHSVSAFTSPTTTLGNVSSSVAQHLGVNGIQIDQSVTCSTSMHALLNGIAWLQADMADAFIVGGTEAALTPFTVAQMKSLRLYSTSENKMACESMRFQKTKNTMVLGEGAALALLERGVVENAIAVIKGYGFASEILKHQSSISENADCFQKSMRMALGKAGLETVDAIVLHAPGTVKGDQAEKNAIDAVFGKQLPLLTSNKWMVGHTFAASGMLSLELATLMLEHNTFIENPFYSNARHLPETLKTVMVNAVGFGGNAVSVIITLPDYLKGKDVEALEEKNKDK